MKIFAGDVFLDKGVHTKFWKEFIRMSGVRPDPDFIRLDGGLRSSSAFVSNGSSNVFSLGYRKARFPALHNARNVRNVRLKWPMTLLEFVT